MRYLFTFAAACLALLAGCAGPGPAVPTVPAPEGELIWLTNASLVDFGNVHELHNRPALRKVPRYEGFFELYREGERDLTPEQAGHVVAPEVEWVLVLTDPADVAEARRTGEWGPVRAELRCMIEGKNLDVLRRLRRERHPDWRAASAENNVVARMLDGEAAAALRGTLAELDAKLGSGELNPFAEVERVPVGRDPATPVATSLKSHAGVHYWSDGRDLRKLLRQIRAGGAGDQPALAVLVGEVAREHAAQGGGGQLRAVNLSLHGNTGAVVVEPGQFGRAALGALVSYLWPPSYWSQSAAVPVRAMGTLAGSALAERDPARPGLPAHGLGPGEQYHLRVYRSCDDRERFVQSGGTDQALLAGEAFLRMPGQALQTRSGTAGR